MQIFFEAFPPFKSNLSDGPARFRENMPEHLGPVAPSTMFHVVWRLERFGYRSVRGQDIRLRGWPTAVGVGGRGVGGSGRDRNGMRTELFLHQHIVSARDFVLFWAIRRRSVPRIPFRPGGDEDAPHGGAPADDADRIEPTGALSAPARPMTGRIPRPVSRSGAGPGARRGDGVPPRSPGGPLGSVSCVRPPFKLPDSTDRPFHGTGTDTLVPSAPSGASRWTPHGKPRLERRPRLNA